MQTEDPNMVIYLAKEAFQFDLPRHKQARRTTQCSWMVKSNVNCKNTQRSFRVKIAITHRKMQCGYKTSSILQDDLLSITLSFASIVYTKRFDPFHQFHYSQYLLYVACHSTRIIRYVNLFCSVDWSFAFQPVDKSYQPNNRSIRLVVQSE